jgi:hypothetical protein
MSKYYSKLGKLPIDIIENFKNQLLKLKKTNNSYQWIQFDKNLNNYFNSIFDNTELKIQYDPVKDRYVQKAFYSEPNYGFRIHRDGIMCKSALNIAVSCNDSDWVRWYDDDVINSLNIETKTVATRSRNLKLYNYENIEYIEELHTEIGDVYTLDVDTFHSFKCIGTEPRIIIQTKFDGFPDFHTINKSLATTSFKNLISTESVNK